MAEDESRTSSVNQEGASSSKDVHEEKHDSWLQLGIGSNSVTTDNQQVNRDREAEPTPPPQNSRLLELDFFLPGGGGGGATSLQHTVRPFVPTFHPTESISIAPPPATSISLPLLFQNPRTTSFSFPPTWGYTPHPASSFPLIPSIPLQQPGTDGAGPSSTMTIIDPPRRPQSHIWFSLRASEIQLSRCNSNYVAFSFRCNQC